MPREFKHILIPFDNSPSSRVALRTAVNLSTIFNSKMSLVYVQSGGKGEEEKLEEIRDVIDKVHRKTGLEIYFLHPKGKMYREVVKTAVDVESDLIIMGTHGMSGFEEFWIGSNAYRVVSSSKVPVITMQETYAKENFERIVIPIDDSRESRQKLPMVMTMARIFNSEVFILGASKYGDPETVNKVNKYVQQSEDILNKEEIECTTASQFGTNVADATMSYAYQVDADLIIMMAESEPSSGLFMGTNAQRLVNHCKIPVLTMHAKDVNILVAGY